MISASLVFLAWPAYAEDLYTTTDEPFIEAITIGGGPIWTKHFQSGDENFREDHGLGILKVETNGYGNWGLYFLSPNSVDDTSVGAGYVTDPYEIPLFLDTRLELTGAIGLVTGYQDYPVPLLAAEARFVAFESGPWSAGLSMAALPYIMEDQKADGSTENEFGIVTTTPFLSIRYQFD